MGMFSLLPPARKVFTDRDAAAVLERIQNKPTIAVDTETTGLNRVKDIAVNLALSDGVDRWSVWPSAIPYFKEFLEDPSKDLVFHNAKYDGWMLLNVGIDLNRNGPRNRYRMYDTMVMHHMLNDVAPHDLKSITKWFLGIDMVPFREVFNMKTDKTPLAEKLLNPDNADVVANYASLDAFATMRIFTQFKKMLGEMTMTPGVSGWDYYQSYELPFTRVLWSLERNGIKIDKELLLSWAPVLEEELMQIRKWFCRELNVIDVNPSSNDQMIKLFYGKLGRRVTSRTASGAPQINAYILERWAAGGCKYAEKLLRYKDLNKQLGTYILNVYDKVHIDGRVHGQFNQTGARTGRLSSSDPNLQNQAPFIREAYVAEFGNILKALDYAQLEMRILAHRSKDPTLIDAIRRGLDIHCATAATMYDEKYERIKAAKDKDDEEAPLTPEDKRLLQFRKASKAIGFGLVYGQGAAKLASTLRVERDEAKALIKRFFDKLPNVPRHLKAEIKKAKRLGYCTNHLGRRRVLPGFKSIWNSDVAAAERMTKNTPIQSTAAEVAKLSMIALHEDEDVHSAGVKMLIQVHDELVFEMPKHMENDRDLNDRLRDIMMHPFTKDLDVPLEVSGKSGPNWLACK